MEEIILQIRIWVIFMYFLKEKKQTKIPKTQILIYLLELFLCPL